MSRRLRSSVDRNLDSQNLLEHRRLLAVAFATVNPISKEGDFTGPTSSVGPDGNKDIRIELKDLPIGKNIGSVLITAQFSNDSLTFWKYGDNKEGLPYAEFIRVSNTGPTNWPNYVDGTDSNFRTAFIYVSPPGGSLAIKKITVSVKYTDNSTDPDIWKDISQDQSLTSLHTIEEDDSRSPAPTVPTYLSNAAEFQTNQFNGTEFSTVKKGDFHIKLTSLPAGKSYSDIQEIYLDDGTGAAQGKETASTISYGSAVWSSVYGRGSYRLTIDKKSTYADIYAQPIRNG